MKKKPTLFFLIITSFGLLLPSLSADAQWEPTNGPIGTSISALSANNNYVFAGIYDQLYRKTINSNIWEQANLVIPYPSYPLSIAANGNTVFVGSRGNGLFLSTDNGGTWTAIDNGLSNPFIYSVVISGNNIFAGTDSGVFLSTNNGSNWNAVDNGLPLATFVPALIVNGSNIFAATRTGIYLTNNNGSSWTAVNNSLTDTCITALAVDNGNILAATCHGIVSSSNNGNTWTLLHAGEENIYAITPFGNSIFAATDSGILSSNDNGNTWMTTGLELPNNSTYAFAIGANNIYADTRLGVFLSIDSGNSWTAMNTGIALTNAGTLTSSGNNVFASSGGLLLSTVNGDSWKPTTGGLQGYILSLASDSSNIYAGLESGGFFSSGDGGNTWSAHNNYLPTQSSYISQILLAGNNVFIVSENNGVLLSTKNWDYWSYVGDGMFTQDALSVAVKDSLVFAGTQGSGIYLSDTIGLNDQSVWTKINNGLPVSYVEALAVSGNNILAGTKVGIFLSVDNGNNWTLNTLNDTMITCFLVNNNIVFAGTGYGVFLSVNYGLNWTAINDGWASTYPNISSLTISGSNIFAGTYTSGVWKRSLYDALGIKDLSNNSRVKVYPNPNNGNFTIENEGDIAGDEVFLTDMTGRKILSQRIASGKSIISATGLASGIYILSIVNETGILGREKIVIQ